MSAVGRTGLSRENEQRVFSLKYFQVGKLPFLFTGFFSLEVEDKLKSTVLAVGLGFGMGSLIVAVWAKGHRWVLAPQELPRKH